MSESDDIDVGEHLFWTIAGISPGQTPEFGVVAATYIDRDGERRINWHIITATDGVELEPVLELLAQVARSVQMTTTGEVPFDPFEG